MSTSPESSGTANVPIDDIAKKLETYTAGDYWHPKNGVIFAQAYTRVLDLSTRPGQLDAAELDQLKELIQVLNDENAHIQLALKEDVLKDEYASVCEQVNIINSADPGRQTIPAMQATILEQTNAL